MSATDNLLRFLTKEAKLPLATAIAQAKELQKANLITIEDLANAGFETLKSISPDEKAAKWTLTAAKRVSIKRKRGLPEENSTASTKRLKADAHELTDPAEIEASLKLPTSPSSDEELSRVVLITNRAPLVLAFAATLVKYTMPEQPPSSRLSLAQAVTSMNAKTKATNIGLDKTKPAEEEGWGQGQPLIRVMGRDIRVLKRWGYEWKPQTDGPSIPVKTDDPDKVESEDPGQKQSVTESQDASGAKAVDEPPALWALDLERLKHLNAPPIINSTASTTGLPIYTPSSAYSYIMKAFDTAAPPDPSAKKKTPKQVTAEREVNLGHLVKALGLLFQSWSDVLSPEELDKRAWNWYVKVRPEVEGGAKGWGAKGQVKLKDILDLRRTA